MGYYIKNTSGQDKVVTFTTSNTANKAAIYKGWNLLANSSDQDKSLSTMTYPKKTCTDGGADPINCTGYFSTVALRNLNYGNPGTSAAAYSKIYYVAKPNANASTPDPFTIFDVVKLDGASNVIIPAGGVFWLYIFQ